MKETANKIKIPQIPSWVDRCVYALILILVLLFVLVPDWRSYLAGILVLIALNLGIGYFSDRQFKKETRERIRGDKVTTETRLDPFGKIRYGNEIVDAVSESGELIDTQTPCVVLDCVKGGYLVKEDSEINSKT